MRVARVLLTVAVATLATAARADAEHDRIRAERSAANTRLADQERECETHFIAATCIEDARNENRATLTRLRQQELQLDEGRRRAAAEARRKVIADKAEAQQARASDAEAQAQAPRVHVRRDPQAAPLASKRASDAEAPHAPAAVASAASRAATEQRSEQKFDARTRALQAHKVSVERRNAERAAQGKVAAPLRASSPP